MQETKEKTLEQHLSEELGLKSKDGKLYVEEIAAAYFARSDSKEDRIMDIIANTTSLMSHKENFVFCVPERYPNNSIKDSVRKFYESKGLKPIENLSIADMSGMGFYNEKDGSMVSILMSNHEASHGTDYKIVRITVD